MCALPTESADRTAVGRVSRVEYGPSRASLIGIVLLAVVVLGGTAAGWSYYQSNVDDVTARAAEVDYTPPAAPQQEEPLRVAFIGDSYTAGAGSESGGFVQMLANREGWIVKNLGTGGTGYISNTDQDPASAQLACGLDSCPNYPEQIDAAAAFKPDVVIVSGGRNNVATPAAELGAGVPAFFEELRRKVPDAEIWVTSPLWDDDAPPADLTRVAEIVKAAAARVDAVYLNLGQPLAGHRDWLADDGVHPNDRGHEAIAEAIEAKLP